MKAPESHRGEAEDITASNGATIVRNRAIADLLTRPGALDQLEPFLARETSVSEAAARSGIKPNTMLARVRRWLEMGLLVETRSIRRHGRPIRLYRTASDAYFVPFDTTSAESLEAGLAERDEWWEKRLRRSVIRARQQQAGTWGTRVYRDVRGRMQMQMAVSPERNWTNLNPGAPAVLSAWRDSLQLDFEDAKRLQHELFALLLRYQQLEGSQRYIIRLGLAPLAE